MTLRAKCVNHDSQPQTRAAVKNIIGLAAFSEASHEKAA